MFHISSYSDFGLLLFEKSSLDQVVKLSGFVKNMEFENSKIVLFKYLGDVYSYNMSEFLKTNFNVNPIDFKSDLKKELRMREIHPSILNQVIFEFYNNKYGISKLRLNNYITLTKQSNFMGISLEELCKLNDGKVQYINKNSFTSICDNFTKNTMLGNSDLVDVYQKSKKKIQIDNNIKNNFNSYLNCLKYFDSFMYKKINCAYLLKI